MRRCFQERAAGRSAEPSPTYLPPPATSHLRLRPRAPPALVNYQQEPAEHAAGFLCHRNNSIDNCRSPFPSSPSSPAPPNTRGYAWCSPDLTRDGHESKSHTSANLEIQARSAGSSHSTVSQMGPFAAPLQSLHGVGHQARSLPWIFCCLIRRKNFDP